MLDDHAVPDGTRATWRGTEREIAKQKSAGQDRMSVVDQCMCVRP